MSMTDFDKLIKEKVEEATYPYDAKAWKQFQKKSGMGRGTLKYWVAGASAVLVVGGVSAFLLSRPSSDTVPNLSNEQPVVMQDTFSQVTNSTDDHYTADTFAVKSEKSGSSKTPSITPVSDVSNQTKPDLTVPATKPTKTVVRYGKPLVIDVDTIKDNVPSDEELKNGHSRLN